MIYKVNQANKNMDIFAHFFWTYAVFHKTKKPWLSAFFGIIPDLLSFGFLFASNFIFGGGIRLFSSSGPISKYVTESYNYTHSLIIFFGVLMIIYFLTKRFYVFLLGWPLHILLDIPTHTNKFFPTPFLFPISNYTFNGVSWSNNIFTLINYSALFLAYIFIFRNNIKKIYKPTKK